MLRRVLDALVGAARPHGVAAARGVRGTASASARLASARRPAETGVGLVAAAHLVGLEGPLPVGAPAAAPAAQRIVSRTAWMRCGSHGLELLGHVASRLGSVSTSSLKAASSARVAQHAAQRVERRPSSSVAPRRRRSAHDRTRASASRCAGFPAVEGVGVVRQQHQQFGVVEAVVQRSPAPRSRAAATAPAAASTSTKVKRCSACVEHQQSLGPRAASAASRTAGHGRRGATRPIANGITMAGRRLAWPAGCCASVSV